MNNKSAVISAGLLMVALASADAIGAPGGRQRQRLRDGSCPAIQAQQANPVVATAPQADPPAQQGPQCPQCCMATAAGPTTRPAIAQPAAPATQPTRLGRGPGAGRGQGMGNGRGMGAGVGQGMGAGMGGGMPQPMADIHTLLSNHQKIKRDVQDIPGGVLTTTTSDDPKVAELLRTHVKAMKARLESGMPIRLWDPTYAELYQHREKIRLNVEEIPGGLKVTHTSEDPQVTLLIRQHARKGVSEFVADGWNRVHQPTPLPTGYLK